MPLGVCRSSGSRVRFPTRTTLLMFAMLLRLLFAAAGSFRRAGRRGSVLRLARRSFHRFPAGSARALAALDTPRGQVTHDAVGDLEDARQLVERLGLCVELEQVVDPVALLLDRIR